MSSSKFKLIVEFKGCKGWQLEKKLFGNFIHVFSIGYIQDCLSKSIEGKLLTIYYEQ